ncbi:hypothetical protein HMPREF0724_11380 [Prescottella equi ATCC 33707]|uniref:Uncharacterized protein n=1 Tax=Prescottella equi ATCC 33707 TaxID=525370 RepID=E9SZ88_RHOHA|nr:hypothetical protein HMPREF0724_11380 [Prescottella equi ATCC 33707]
MCLRHECVRLQLKLSPALLGVSRSGGGCEFPGVHGVPAFMLEPDDCSHLMVGGSAHRRYCARG